MERLALAQGARRGVSSSANSRSTSPAAATTPTAGGRDKPAAEFDVDRGEPVVTVQLLEAPTGRRCRPTARSRAGAEGSREVYDGLARPRRRRGARRAEAPFQLKFSDTTQPGVPVHAHAEEGRRRAQPGGSRGKPDPLGGRRLLGICGERGRCSTKATSAARTPTTWSSYEKARPAPRPRRQSVHRQPQAEAVGPLQRAVDLPRAATPADRGEQAWAVRTQLPHETGRPGSASPRRRRRPIRTLSTPLPTANGEARARRQVRDIPRANPV